MARFLFATWNGGGVVVPATAIARDLKDRGHDVRFVGHAAQAAHFSKASLPFAPYATAGGFEGTSPAALLRVVFSTAIPRDVVAELAAHPADVVVVDSMLFGLMKGLGRARPRYAVLGASFDGLLRTAPRPIHALIRAAGYPLLDLVDAGSPVMTASLPELDHGHGPVIHIGPVARGVQANPGSPAVLVSLSTAPFPGLAATWQKLLDTLGDQGVRVIATTGPAVDPTQLRIPGNAEVHRFLPHEDLLPQISAVIGHGGHGTAMAALVHGIPQLVIPLAGTSDQPLVGKALERAGVGITLTKGAPTAAVRGAVERLLTDSVMRDAAARLGERARALDGRTRGADLLEAAAAGI